MRLWQQQIRMSDRLAQAGFRWRRGVWCKDTWMIVIDVKSALQSIGRVNSDRWYGLEPHALQLVGIDARRRDGNTVDVTYRLASRRGASLPKPLTAAMVYGETAFANAIA